MDLNTPLPFDQVRGGQRLPDGTFNFLVESLTPGETQEKHFFCVKGAFRVTSDDCTNQTHTETFTLGNDQDPNADDPQTWVDSMGMGGLKRLGRALGFDMDLQWTLQQIIENFPAKQFTGEVSEKERKKAPGIFDTNIRRYYKLGEVPARLKSAPAPTRAAVNLPPSRPTATAARPSAPAAARPNGPIARPTPAARPAPANLPAGFSIEE